MISQQTNGAPHPVLVEFADGTIRLLEDVVRLYYPPELYPDVLARVTEEALPPAPKPQTQWIDCAMVPANVEDIIHAIEALGQCKIEVLGRNKHIATDYIPPSCSNCVDDDLELRDGTHLGRYWNPLRHHANPTHIGRLVTGYEKVIE